MTTPPPPSGEDAPSLSAAPTPRESIGNESVPAVFRQSYNQHALWFLHRLDPLSSAYNLSFAVNLEQPPADAILKKNLLYLQTRHEALRTTFLEENGEALQQVHAEAKLPFEIKDARTWTADAVTQFLADAAERPFNLRTGPLWRVVLLRGEKRAALMICAHHIISDFQSLVLLFEELCDLCGGQALQPLSVTYRDYTLRQQKLMESPRGEKLKAWWREHLASAETVLDLPTDKPRPTVQMHHGDSVDFHLPDALADALAGLASDQGVSLHTLLLSGLQALLHRLSDADSVSVGSPASGRDKAFRRCIGYYLNPLVQHADFRNDPSFADLLQQMHGTGLKILRRRALPFELLVRELQPQRDPGRSPLFQVMFTLLDAPSQDAAGAVALGRKDEVMTLAGVPFSARPMPHRLSQFDLSLFMTRTETGLAGSFDYNTDLFEPATIARWAVLLENILTAMTTDVRAKISATNLLSPADEACMRRINDTTVNLSPGCTIHGAFAARAAQEPERTAVIFEDQKISYRTVEQRARALAAALQQKGVVTGDRVAVCLPRTPDLIPTVLGIMRVGAAWVPLDPHHPVTRLDATAHDAGVRAVVVHDALAEAFADITVIPVGCMDIDANPQPVSVDPAHTAYILYTSGSTGKPKGVAVSHANAANFFDSMDRVVGSPKPGADVWCAVTNLTFDIAVLELLWAPSRGFTVLLQATQDGALHGPAGRLRHRNRTMDFGLFYFADSETDSDNKYRLLTEGAQFADRNGFTSVWTPERHFHSFGGLYPNPAVSGAAVGALTKNVAIRAGSVVLPINDPIRIAEEWSLVDNLTEGRAGISIASGWNADDFVLSPQNFRDNKGVMLRNLEIIRTLWRGDTISRRNGIGEMIDLAVHPRPIQAELPVWMTAAGSPETFRLAGELGVSLLTHLLGQTLEDLEEKIEIYRRAFAASERPGTPYVTLMLHTFVDDDAERVKALVQEPFRNYLRGSFGLMKGLAKEMGLDVSSPEFTQEHRELLVDHAFNRFYETSALFGTPQSCLRMIDRLKGIGVDEVGCLIDFGVPLEDALRGLNSLNELRQRSAAQKEQPKDYSFARQVATHGATHLQCTPSFMHLLLADQRAQAQLNRLQTILLGGEALSDALVQEVRSATDASIINMYGPTETTIWSTTQRVGDGPVCIGKPIGNTTVHVLDRYGRPRPVGAQGELWLGGAGVARGYLNRPALTAERFRPDPSGNGHRLYRTGDAVRMRADGRLDFLGRVDHQIKLRGFRIELGEIEAVLAAAPHVHGAAVLVQGQRLIAFVTAENHDEAALRTHAGDHLPEYMVPARVIFLETMPLSPAGKIDRKALSALGGQATRSGPVAQPKNEVEARIITIWKELLGRDDIGVNDSFFELGGHSLLLAQAHAQLQEDYGKDLDMVVLFRYPTVSSLARFLNSRQQTGAQKLEQKSLQRKRRRQRPLAERAVAVIGMACRFPGANTIDAFWQNLTDGTNSVRFFSDEELRKAGVSPEQLQDPGYVPAGAIIDHAESFDAGFFGYSPAEAALLDPQQRVFLETSWQALENAALDPAQAGVCGVFAGVGMNTYLLNNLMPNRTRLKHLDDFQIMIANDKDFLTTRLAYKLNLHGPGLTIQTACSTSLVAINTACEYLAAGKCDVAIAGGVTVRAPQIEGYTFREGMIASPDGYCRAFDASGAGVLFGSGAGVVVLKPLEAALADGDPIHAVVKGWAVNNDGADKISFPAPGVEGQAAVIREAMDHAGVSPHQMAYVEAHGTATELGDPIEMAALGLAYGDLPPGETVGVGSVKTNFGHLDAASGVAGFIKTALALKHRTLPPSLFYTHPNPRIDFAGNPFYVVHENRTLDGDHLLAGVSSFGIGGTNAHTILEERPEIHDRSPASGPWLFPLSAATATALKKRVADLHTFLAENPSVSLAAVARTLQVGRVPMAYRLAVAASDMSTLKRGLAEAADRMVQPTQQSPGLALMFPGGGAQYVGMGRDLYSHEPVFRREFDRCADLVVSLGGPDPRDMLYPQDGHQEAATQALGKVDNAMPAVFSICYAMARLLEARGLKAQSMIGQSTGEYVAATLAGVFDLKDALAILLKRGELFARTPAGAALSIHRNENEVRPLLNPRLSIALVNGPTDCVVAGDPEALDQLQSVLEGRNINFRRVHLDAAVHSHMLDPILPEFRQFMAGLPLHLPQTRFVSCVTGAWITSEEATDIDYWVRHLRHTNRFGEALDTLLRDNGKVLLEAGPGRTLTTLALRRDDVHAFAAMRHPKQIDDDRRIWLQAIGGLWADGIEVSWEALTDGTPPCRISLPGYPFERQRYWVDPPKREALADMASEPLYFTAPGEVAPQANQDITAGEAVLADLWRPLLGVGTIGRHANFFELGGDSLMATRLRTHIRDTLKRDISLKALFEHPTLSRMAAFLEGAGATAVRPPVMPAPRDGHLPLSFAQQRLWFLDQWEGPSATYNMREALRLTGVFDTAAMEKAVTALVARHETLRTSFQETEEGPSQVIADAATPVLPFIDLSSLSKSAHHLVAARIADAAVVAPFHLSNGPLVRFRILRLSEQEHLFLVVKHHIIGDGWSIGVMVRELTELYRGFTEDRQPALAELPVQYADYAVYQRNQLQGETLDTQLAWWRTQLADAPPLLDLPLDRPRPARQTFNGAAYRFTLPTGLTAALHQLGLEHEVTDFMVLETLFAMLMARYSRSADVLIGSPVANREMSEIEGLIGFFVNTLVLRHQLHGDPGFAQCLQRTADTAHGAYAHQDAPFELVVDACIQERTQSYSPLFQVMFILQNVEMGLQQLPGLELTSTQVDHISSMFDLTLFLEEKNGYLDGMIEYNTDLFDEATMQRLAGHYIHLAEAVLADAQTPVSRLPMMPEEERHTLLTRWNQTEEPRGADLLPQRILTTAAAHPQTMAVQTAGAEAGLTYAQLAKRIKTLAASLQAEGAAPGRIVGVYLDRSPDLVSVLAAIQLTGAAYLPLDPGFPAGRLNYMVDHAEAQLLVTHSTRQNDLNLNPAVRLLLLDQIDWTAEAHPAPVLLHPCHTAYVIYTSGSTGHPKGVVVSHGALINFLDTMAREPGIQAQDRLLAVTTISFDIAGLELFLPLTQGATVVLATRDQQADGAQLRQLLDTHRITVMQATPATWRLLLLAGWTQSPHLTILCGGEALPRELARRLLSRGKQLWNLYGPTETTIWSARRAITTATGGDDAEGIGGPIGATTLHVLDPYLQPVPFGVAGELHIGGQGLAQGYHRQPALTAQAFRPNPFEGDGARLYRTGDLVRRRPDGGIEFMGRVDHQVKVRGYRIELGEIEALLEQDPAVSQCTTVVREDVVGDPRIVSYLTGNPDAPVSDQETEEMVAGWADVWNDAYAAENIDPTFNINGWNDSYTGKTIEAAQMRAWLDGTTRRILAHKPQRVLEIGCGTGLILFSVAPHVAYYLGSDIADEGLQAIRSGLVGAGLREVAPGAAAEGVALIQIAADALAEGLNGRQFDIIILNSTAQYFPDQDYLWDVLHQAVDLLTDDGHIFVGDVRDLDLLPAFHASLLQHRSPEPMDSDTLALLTAEAVARETELALHPEWFARLCDTHPRLSSLDILLKPAEDANELNRFRYDVILHVGAAQPVPQITRATFRNADPAQALAQLPEILVLDDVPNQHLSPDGFFPSDLEKLAPDTYQLSAVRPSRSENGAFTAVFTANGFQTPPWRHLFPADPSEDLRLYNAPLLGRLNRDLAPRMRRLVQSNLPAYMIPAAFVMLEHMPLTPNGKVDRKILAQHSRFKPGRSAAADTVFVAPRTETEIALAHIWSTLLGIDPVGVNHSFFELGGHSLLATRLRSHIYKRLQRDLSLKELFDHPRLGSQAVLLDQKTPVLDRPPVTPVPRDGTLPLSFAQQRLWFLDQLEGSSTAYHMHETLRLTGAFDAVAMQAATQELLRRHETLRTTFHSEAGLPYQCIAEARETALPFIDLSGLANEERHRHAIRIADAAVIEPFDLACGPLVRFRLLRLQSDEHVLFMVKHHIISDGWSMGILVRELTECYRAGTAGRPPMLTPLPVQYADYAVYQRKQLQGEVLETQLNWWRTQLAGAPPLLDLPLDQPRPPEQTFTGAAHHFTLPGRLTGALQDLANSHGVTQFMMLETLFATLMARYSGSTDVSIGTPIANREMTEIEGLIGLFVNTLVLRHQLNDDPSFAQCLKQTAETAHGAYAHQNTPFELVVDACVQKRDRAYAPLFQTMFILQNVAMQLQQLPGLHMTAMPVKRVSAMFDLTLIFAEEDSCLKGIIEYNTDLFNKATILRLADHYQRLCEAVLTGAEVPISQLQIIGPDEREAQLFRWNQTVEPRSNELLPLRILHIAKQHPHLVAVADALTKERLTYQNLTQRVQRLAAVLQEKGAGPERYVGVYLDRSPDLLVTVLAIQWTGAAYLPLDPGFPLERLHYMMEDAGVRLLVTHSRHVEGLGLNADIQVLQLDKVASTRHLTVPVSQDPNHAAYIIYTSGSTGQPKGVVITHGALANFLDTMAQKPGMQREDRLLAVTTISFDIAGLELYLPLIRGGQVVMATREQAGDGAQLLELLDTHGITVMQATPATWRLMLQAGWTKTPALTILCGGEALPRNLARRLLTRGRALWNLYGPTETTIWSARRAIGAASSGDDAESIGGPIGATALYVLDAHLQPVPFGVAGELFIGGAGLARGYHQQPALTAAAFIPNPFQGDGHRLYRTGDLVRRRVDGDLEFIGRVDHQVKVRGYRIELGEIEALLEQDPAVRQATAVIREDVQDDPRIIAYLTGTPDLQKDLAARMRGQIQQSLPAYMIPSAFILLEQMPLTPNGKVNRKALAGDVHFRPDRTGNTGRTNLVAPRNETEAVLLEIWSSLLSIDTISVHDNFFELGGHSLLAVRLLHKIGERLAITPTLGDLFEAPTIAGLAVFVASAEANNEAIPPLPQIQPNPEQATQPFPLTDVQHAYLVGRSSAFELGNIATHGYTEFDCIDLDISRVQSAWNKLIRRHGMLRAVFHEDGTQTILEDTPDYVIDVRDLSDVAETSAQEELTGVRESMSHMVHDPARWPLFTLEATRLDDHHTRIHLSIDMLIIDAWSGFILFQEWTRFYQEPDWQPEPLALSFRDYVQAAQDFEKHPAYTKAMDYWRQQLPNLPPAPDLPLAMDPADIQVPHFERRRGRLEPACRQRLAERAAAAGISDSALLLTAFGEILNRWTRNSAFTINLTLFNRLPLHDEINSLVGDFTTTTLLAVRGEGEHFTARARNLQQQLWRDLDHRQVGGVRLLRELARMRGDARAAAMPVVFTSTLGTAGPGDNSKIGNMVYAITQTPQVWLDHQVMEEEGALVYNWDFVAGLFPEQMVDAMFTAYNQLLTRLLEDETVWQAPYIDLLPTAQARLRAEVNSDIQAFPLTTTLLHTLFAEQAVKTPDHPAVFCGERVLDYQTIYRRAEFLGRQLEAAGVGPGQLVAVSLHKGWEQVVAVLAVLRAGGAYVPMDPNLPAERLLWLAETCKVAHVLTHSTLTNSPWPDTLRVHHVDQAGLATGPLTPWAPRQSADDIAYIIFTSGSTGQPKGVVIDHQGAVNTILDINRRWGVGAEDRVFAISSLSFDLSVYDVFGLLAVGGALVYPEPEKLRDPGHWQQLIQQHHVTLWNSVPALMRMLVEYADTDLGKLRLCLMSGDWIPVSLPDRIKALAADIEVVSLGGATEASIWSIFHPIGKVEAHWESIPYGKPLANQGFHVLNQKLEPCPDFVPGDLYITGKGLALGYWADEAKTNASFFNHPRTGRRLYRTGDLGRYLPNGEIEFLGREDFQVKVGGYRIELGEIENALEQHPAVAAAVVSAPGNKNNRRLVAYVQPAEQTPDGVLVNPLARTEFKLSQAGVREAAEDQERIALFQPEPDPQAWIRRQSFRRFQPQPIPAQNFGRFLACLGALPMQDKPIPKRRYASAGSLYPVQLYLCLHQDAVEGLTGGAYYYHPGDHQLVRMGETTAVPPEAYAPFNQSIAREARVQLFLVGNLAAVRPIYGDQSHPFCMLEAGYMAQLMMTTAAEEGLGLCPVGGLQEDHIETWFQLEGDYCFLHGFLGGAVSPQQQKVWDGEPPESQPASITDELKTHLASRVPDYMIPSQFVPLETLPLTANGKVDRKALPDPDREADAPATAYAAPQTWTEVQLAEIAENLLGVSPVGLHDNFFDLGADSLIATRFLARIRQDFGCALTLRTLFEHMTVSTLAVRIDASLASAEPTVSASTDMMEGVL